MTTDYIKINVLIKDIGDAQVTESPWAEPVLATDFGGDYRLHSDLVLAPLRRGDVVRCEVTADGSLQAVDIRHVLPGLLISFEHPRGTDATVKRVLRAVQALGYEVGRPFDGCAQVFIPGAEFDRDIPFARVPDTWQRRELLDGPFRMRAALEQIDFSRAPAPLSATDYVDHREPDDPGLARLEPELMLPS